MQITEIRYLWPSFNDIAIKNFASFIAITLIIARKTITAVFGTIALQLIYRVSMSLFCLSHITLLICYTSVSAGTESRKEDY